MFHHSNIILYPIYIGKTSCTYNIFCNILIFFNPCRNFTRTYIHQYRIVCRTTFLRAIHIFSHQQERILRRVKKASSRRTIEETTIIYMRVGFFFQLRKTVRVPRSRGSLARWRRQLAAILIKLGFCEETRALIRSRVFFDRARNTYLSTSARRVCVTFVARGKCARLARDV